MHKSLKHRQLKIVTFSWLLLSFLGFNTQVFAADIPLLTWERGRVQEVVLGGGALENNWTVQLEGKDISPIKFTKSQTNNSGYVVFSIELPSDIPTGGYSIVTFGKGSPRTIVAGVNVIAQIAYDVTAAPKKMMILLSIFVFFTAIISALRASKYAYLEFDNSQSLNISNINSNQTKLLNRIGSAPYNWRINSLARLKVSVFRFLLMQNGELVHRISPKFYSLLPWGGFLLGIISTNEFEKAGGIASASLTITAFIAILSVLDTFSGIFALIGLWLSQILLGNVTSVRDFLVLICFALSWIAPSLISNLVSHAITKDVESFSGNSSSRLISIFPSAAIGTLFFYFGQEAMNSLLIKIAPNRQISITVLSLIFISITVKLLAEISFLSSDFGLRGNLKNSENIRVARVSSPLTALLVFLIGFGFIYFWTEAADKALITAVLFTIPYLLVFIRLNNLSVGSIGKLKRNILVEATAVLALNWLIFQQISTVPLLSNQKASLLLTLSAIPLAIHAIYSLVWDSSQNKEIIIK